MGILDSIIIYSNEGKQKYTAKGVKGFTIDINQRELEDRKYIIGCAKIALSQLDMCMYYGKLTRKDIEGLLDYMAHYEEIEGAFRC